jgi:hypothetical protein
MENAVSPWGKSITARVCACCRVQPNVWTEVDAFWSSTAWSEAHSRRATAQYASVALNLKVRLSMGRGSALDGDELLVSSSGRSLVAVSTKHYAVWCSRVSYEKMAAGLSLCPWRNECSWGRWRPCGGLLSSVAHDSVAVRVQASHGLTQAAGGILLWP